MEKALNKILDIVSDMSMGLAFAEDSRNFLRDICLPLKRLGKLMVMKCVCL